MIFAEIHGKLGADGSRAHERSEDLLTSTVFGLLRYLPPRDGLVAVLMKSRRVSSEAGAIRTSPSDSWLALDQVSSVEVDFWPSGLENAEPDLLIRLLDSHSTVAHLIALEVKLWSPKSGTVSKDDDASKDGEVEGSSLLPDRDQLVKYWRRLQRIAGNATPTVVYLTPHPSPPEADLRDSLAICPSMRLGWLSWTDIWEALSQSGVAAESAVAADLLLLLEHKGFSRFRGFKQPVTAPLEAGFWRGERWFASASRLPSNALQSIWQSTRD